MPEATALRHAWAEAIEKKLKDQSDKIRD